MTTALDRPDSPLRLSVGVSCPKPGAVTCGRCLRQVTGTEPVLITSRYNTERYQCADCCLWPLGDSGLPCAFCGRLMALYDDSRRLYSTCDHKTAEAA